MTDKAYFTRDMFDDDIIIAEQQAYEAGMIDALDMLDGDETATSYARRYTTVDGLQCAYQAGFDDVISEHS